MRLWPALLNFHKLPLTFMLTFQLISIKIEAKPPLDWTDYRMIDGMHKNKLFHRRRGHSVEMTAEDARKRGIQRARAMSPTTTE